MKWWWGGRGEGIGLPGAVAFGCLSAQWGGGVVQRYPEILFVLMPGDPNACSHNSVT